MKINVPKIGQRIETERKTQIAALAKPEIAETTKPEKEGASSVLVGVDAGYIRSNVARGKGSRKFGVVAAKTAGENSRCHAYVQAEVDNGSEGLVHFIELEQETPDSSVTFFTDAGADIKSATSLISPSGKVYQRILDWFHLAMYFQIMALGDFEWVNEKSMHWQQENWCRTGLLKKYFTLTFSYPLYFT